MANIPFKSITFPGLPNKYTVPEISNDLMTQGKAADAKATGDALALKANQSTTYTKTEVDALIESVDVETDTTLSVSGKPADAKKTGDEISAIKADLDAVGTTLDSYGDALGSVVTFSKDASGDKDYSYTITAGTTITFVSDVNLSVIQIKNGSTIVKGLGSVTANTPKTYTAEANSDTIRIYFSAAGTVTGTIEGNLVKKSEMEQAVDGLESASNKVTALTASATDTQYPSAKVVYDEIQAVNASVTTAIDGSVGAFTFTSDAAGDKYYDYPITGGENYIVYASVRLSIFATYNGTTQVESLSYIDAGTYKKFKASANAARVRIYWSGAGSVVLIRKSFILGASSGSVLKNNYYGKTMCVIGDSLSQPFGTTLAWHSIIRDRYRLTVQNLSVSGAAYSKDGSMQNVRYTDKIKSITGTPDIIVVFGGTNDYSQNVPLGALSDASSDANGADFIPAVKYTMEYLLTHYPDALIIYITPLQRNYTEGWNATNSVGKYLYEYVNAIKQCAAIYGVQLCDLYATSGFHVYNADFKETYTYINEQSFPHGDGLHPNVEGTKLYTENAIIPVFDRLLLGQNDYEYAAFVN